MHVEMLLNPKPKKWCRIKYVFLSFVSRFLARMLIADCIIVPRALPFIDTKAVAPLVALSLSVSSGNGMGFVGEMSIYAIPFLEQDSVSSRIIF